jgi:hypothetical protein
MPFRSQAQRRLFYARPELRKYIAEYEAETPKNLPEHIRKALKQRRKKHTR